MCSPHERAAVPALAALLVGSSVSWAGNCAPLVINEVDYDQPGTDTAEFIEIKNVSAAAINLDPYTIVLVNGATGLPYMSIDLPASSLPAGDYFVICGSSGTVPNCDLDVSPDTNLIQNGSPDAIAIVLNETVIDALSYEGSIPGYVEGTPAGGDNNVDPAVGLSRIPDGADSNDNATDFQLVLITPGAANADVGKGAGACGADVNQDGAVNVTDLLAVIGAWGPCPVQGPCSADVAPAGGDCAVNVTDLLAIIGAWGPCT